VLRLPADLDATLDAHTGDGGITVDLPVKMTGAVRDNALHGTLNDGGGEIDLRTGDGSIVIEPYFAAASHARGWDDSATDSRRVIRSVRHRH
jgi:hypothetical protein